VASNSKRRKSQDPYALTQARQRKAANLSRQRVLREQRTAALGDPVTGHPTPFTESLQARGPPKTLSVQGDPVSNNNNTTFIAAQTTYLNHCVSSRELDAALTRSQKLTEPVKNTDSSSSDPQAVDEVAQSHQDAHNAARVAVNRIMQLDIGSSKDRTRVNIQRCIDNFGRHNTDTVLRPKPVSYTHPSAPIRPSRAPRAGPDTGSPEVQAAILTTKILVLARQLETTGHKDKHNKRNLRLLVHRRQKLLNYLRRKERGGPRWQNLIASLGLTDAAWKGEISL
jgi:ribosomal protein S15